MMRYPNHLECDGLIDLDRYPFMENKNNNQTLTGVPAAGYRYSCREATMGT